MEINSLEASTPQLRVTNNSSTKIKIEMYYDSAGTDHESTKDVAAGSKNDPCPRDKSINYALINNDKNLQMVKSPVQGKPGFNQFEIKIQHGPDTISVVAIETDSQ